MKTKAIIIITALTLSSMLFAANGFSDIPAPPVNQTLGMPDGILNNLVEAECRACHDDPEFGGPSNPDRHHLLYGSALIKGECSVNGIIGDNETCLTDADCDRESVNPMVIPVQMTQTVEQILEKPAVKSA